MKKPIIFLLILSFVLAIGAFSANPAFAQTVQPDTQSLIPQLQEQIKLLQEQVKSLQTEVSSTKIELEAVKTELKFTKVLRLGARGDEVKELQEFLKQFPDIYPQGLVSGYFGPFTETAVRKFQEKQGIESIGVVGPKTLSKLNEFVISTTANPNASSTTSAVTMATPVASTIMPYMMPGAVPSKPSSFYPSSSITVLYPNGGEKFQKSSKLVIKWNSANVSKIYIKLRKGADTYWGSEGAITYSELSSGTATNVVLNKGFYQWTIPKTLPDGNDYAIRIFDANYGGPIDDSDTTFSILTTIPSVATTSTSTTTVTPSGTVPATSATPATPATPTVTSATPAIPATPAVPATMATTTTTTMTPITTPTTTTTIDTTPPSVTLTGPNPGFANSNCTVKVGYIVSDNVAIIGLQQKVDGINYGSEFIPSTGGPPGSITTTTTCLNLGNGTHTYTVVVRDAAGNITTKDLGFSLPLTTADTTFPSIPTNLIATAISSTQVNLSWSASTDNVGVAGYKIYRGGIQVANVTGTSYSDTVPIAGTTYSYGVSAYDAAGNTTVPASVTVSVPSSSTSTTTLNFRSKNLAAISQMLNSLNEILKQLSQILK